jgi:endonuclease/exonuclease/phosphatase family metal-dependent hydrolase
VQENTQVNLPVAVDFGTGQLLEVVNFTDRDVVLARSDVKIIEVASGNYQAEFPLGGDVILKRGWIRVEAHFRGEIYNFVNTHLEGQSLAAIQAIQVQELLGSVLAGLDGITILVGDLNSDAEAGPGDPSWTPTYDELIDKGFVDTWDQGHPRSSRPGFTCCHDPDLLNLRAAFDERIDFVLFRDDRGAFDPRVIEAARPKVVGDKIADLTSGGLWPSDHGGLISRLRLIPRRFGDEDDDEGNYGGENDDDDD